MIHIARQRAEKKPRDCQVLILDFDFEEGSELTVQMDITMGRLRR